MIISLLWYLALSLLGWLAFPLAYRLLPALAGRGFAFSRALGLLLWSFAFWLLSSIGILANDTGGLVVALLLLTLGAWFAWRSLDPGEIRSWLRQNRRFVITVESLLAIAFIFWVAARSANPSISATEKPMELAFINATLRSASMPPNDPWLSGYSISYYYFGYAQTAMLAKLTGASGGEAFTLAIASVFALTVTSSYGLLYDLLAAWRPKLSRQNLSLSFLGPLFMPLLSNAEGFLELLHARGLFWVKDASGLYRSGFWKWLDIEELRSAPIEPFRWLPRNMGTGQWWWWRASRVIQDYNFVGGDNEVISEFPMFSFILGDLHPHVLVLPFAFLSLAFIFNFLRGGGHGHTRLLRWQWQVAPSTIALGAVIFGGLAFLNIWEFPVHVALFAGAYVLQRMDQHGAGWHQFKEFISLGLLLGFASILAYLPYFLGFASQAGGLVPNLLYPTRGAQLWVMWAPLWLPLFGYLIYLTWHNGGWSTFRRGLTLGVLVFIILWLLSLALPTVLPGFGALAAAVGGWMADSPIPFISKTGLNLNAATLNLADFPSRLVGELWAPSNPQDLPPTIGNIISESFSRRLTYAGGWLSLLALLSLGVGLIAARVPASDELGSKQTADASDSRRFILLLVCAGVMLVSVPEFIYIRDFFGYRINTIFKFYYQAWLFTAMAAAFGAAYLLVNLKRLGSILPNALLLLSLALGLPYTIYGVWDRAQGFQPAAGFRVDGAVGVLSAEDAAAAEWLRNAPLGVLAEAVGGSYSSFARLSTHSGQPAVLGWNFHETQWRGGEVEKGTREYDIARLYSTSNWDEAMLIIQRYNIRYIAVGSLERSAYQVYETKFLRHLTPVFQAGSVVIYEAPRY